MCLSNCLIKCLFCLFGFCICFLDEIHADCAEKEQYAGKDEHIYLVAAKKREYESAKGCGAYLRHTDGAVEEAEVCAHVFARK